MKISYSVRALLVAPVVLAQLFGCQSAVPPVTPPPVTGVPAENELGATFEFDSPTFDDLTFPSVTGSEAGPTTGGTAGQGSVAGDGPPTAPGQYGSSGGGSRDGTSAISFEGFLDHPTFADDSGGSGLTVQVATEAELRSALANTDVANIELTADIDITADAATLDLALEQPIAISGGNHILRARTLTITASGVVLQRLEIPNAIEAIEADFLRIMDSTLGTGNPNVAFFATGGTNLALSECDIEGGSLGVSLASGAVLDMSNCNVRTASGAFLHASDLRVFGGTFANEAFGINIFNGIADIDAVTFSGTASPAISVTANTVGTELSVDDAQFNTTQKGISVGGATAATLAVRTSWFLNHSTAIDINYAFDVWTATFANNTFSAEDGTSVGIDIQVMNQDAGAIAAWRDGNGFFNYGSGKDIISPP